MKLGQVLFENRPTAAIMNGGATARVLAGHTMVSLIQEAERRHADLADFALGLTYTERALTPSIPINPVEVWACGCTYEQSAEFRDSEHGTREGFYHYVYQKENRPEVFFKGTARVCVGPNDPIGLRPDSQFTAPEPELAVVLGSKGRILGYTLANDVSAWDIERENPLYLPQSKTYAACCSLGPVIVTADELTDPYQLEMHCSIQRGEQTLFSGNVSTGRLNRKLETLVEYLLRANPVPAGSVLMTGTGIIVTEEAALREGDLVTIRVPQIGTLVNEARVMS